MNIKQIKEQVTTTACMYGEHTGKTLEEWRKRLETSEVNDYKFIADDIAVNERDGRVFAKRYHSGFVGVWEVK